MTREKITENDIKTKFQNWPFSLIYWRPMSHKFMIHIFLKRKNLNANKKIQVIIDMTHES